MSGRPGKRKAETAAWETHRATITHLYDEEGQNIAEVKRIMGEAPYHFRRTLVHL